ncbi:MAG: glycosyltransferase family 39 protein [Polyangia bacterium]
MKRTAIQLSSLFVVALALCALWLTINPQDVASKRPDAILFERIAHNLASGNGYSADLEPPYRPEVTRSPFLPVLAAGVFVICGHDREAVLWLQAVLVALAVALGFLAAREALGDGRAAFVGAWIACLAPQVTASATAFLTEAGAMLQVTLAAWLLLRWRDWRDRPSAPLAAAAIGLLLASLVLNRANFTPPVLVAAGWLCLGALRSGWRRPRALLSVALLAVFLGAPVLGWSARNASLGFSFSPVAAGGGAGYVFEVKRYRDLLLEPDERIPGCNRRFWTHYRQPISPRRMRELDRCNMEWFCALLAERWPRLVASIPARVAALFGNRAIFVYDQLWPNELDDVWFPRIHWLSRGLWLLSALGLVAVRRRRPARWIWLGSLGPLVLFHAFTACNPRYLTPLLPLLMPYGGAAITAVPGLLRRLRRSGEAS